MKKKDFDELLTSVRQAGKIRRGEAEPSRAGLPISGPWTSRGSGIV